MHPAGDGAVPRRDRRGGAVHEDLRDHSGGAPWGRFDDLRTGAALAFGAPHDILTTTRVEDVAGVLAAVHEATAAGSWAYGFVSYEAAPGLDPLLPGGWRTGQPPLVWFGLCDEPAEVPTVTEVPAAGRYSSSTWQADWSAEEHACAVARVRQQIAAGETYQCNLTDRLRAQVTGDPRVLYARLALAQRGAHNAYLDIGSHVVASGSPELFFEWAGSTVRTRPMKGTARRGWTSAEDRKQADHLRSDPKERAENVMIVDLLRNDLGRVAEVGSVVVDELLTLERYPTVWQLTSQVSARLQDDVGLVELFRALFPCGSVTGAPKQRTMELIAAVEREPRGIYCGSIGYVAPPSAAVRARFSVAIRSAVVERATGETVYGAGGGITWDSDAAREHAELFAKAAVLTHDVSDHDLVETMAYAPPTGLRHLERHLGRMRDSADWFGFRFDDAAVRDALDRAVRSRLEPARVRLLLTRDGSVTVGLSSLPAGPTDPVRLAIDDEPVDSTSPWLRHKTTRRDGYTTRALRHPEADDAVLVNERGEVTETTIANLAVRLEGTWWTPPTTSGCLPGVERAHLIEIGRLQERVLDVADLHTAEDLAVLSSLRGWRPARLVVPSPPTHQADQASAIATAGRQRVHR